MTALTTRAERVREAQRLRAEGLLLREIAERMNAAISTVHAWLSDPDLSKQRARFASYAGTCIDCGAPTCGHNGPKAKPPERCVPCNGKRQFELTHQWIVDSIVEWNERFGAPPAPHDWNFAMARSRMVSPDDCYGRALARYESTGRPWPATTSVYNHFESWPAALRVAGLEPLAPNERWIGHAGMTLRRNDEVAA
jgi:hypothetical protein